MSGTLIDNLRSSAERWPEAVAIHDASRCISYAELWREAGAVAGFLQRDGLKPRDRVALLLENSTEYVAAYYGVLMAGGVVVALNAAARARDLVSWTVHSDARWLIGNARHGDLAETVRGVGEKMSVIALNRDNGREIGVPENGRITDWNEVVGGNEESDTLASPVFGAPAAIIYTSGTTGRPKGVVLSHENLASNVDSILAYLRLTERDRCLNVLPFYYSYGNSVLHTHLAVGGAVVVENSLAYPHNVVQRMVTEGVTGFAGVPSTYALLLNRTKLAEYDLKNLRYLTQAGGAMAPSQIKRLREVLPNVRFFVMYGQTEATARLAYLPPERLEEKLGSAGVAIPGVDLEIRDENGNTVPRGTVGEVCASGRNIMIGYWKDEDATAEVLANGWLRTGDLAYMDDEGFLFITGRSSEMIKSGAHRINPREIEEVIEQLAGVAEVAVVGIPDEILGQAIKAVIVPAPDTKLPAMAVKSYCRANLASYKVPQLIQFVTEIPKTASGKIQRYRLINNSTEEQRVNGKETV